MIDPEIIKVLRERIANRVAFHGDDLLYVDARPGNDTQHKSACRVPCDVLAELLDAYIPVGTRWQDITDEQRLAYLGRYPCCRHCGSLDTGCQCWNDE